MDILIRADGSHQRGMGHISKQRLLAKRLQSLGHQVHFVIQANATVRSLLEGEGHSVFEVSEAMRGEELDPILEATSARVGILDILETSESYVADFQRRGLKVVTFDNVHPSARECDLAFEVMYHSSFEGGETLYRGFDFGIVDEALGQLPDGNPDLMREVLLTQGGADTLGHTPRLLRALKEIELGDCRVNVVLGPSFDSENIRTIQKEASGFSNVVLVEQPRSLTPWIAKSDLVISAGGTTMLEVVAARRPLYVYINEVFEDETAHRLKQAGLAGYDGIQPEFGEVVQSLRRLIEDAEVRRAQVAAMRAKQLGAGLDRVVGLMKERGILDS